MNPFSYEAFPKVVKGKGKYKENTSENVQLITSNPDPHNKFNADDQKSKKFTPLQLEEIAVNKEREQKKIDMLRNQLIEFKKQKDKKTPYEIRPGPAPKIEVDLKYFITEQNIEAPETCQVDIQCDEFKPKPPTPKYLPKKTGIDATTQIWDYDLFDFDREVEPILHVIVDKTIEQASLEINEEHEILAIKQYKKEYEKRKADEREEWDRILKEEIMRLKNKNNLLKKKREIAEKIHEAVKRVEAVQISKNYLKDCFRNSLKFFIDRDFWRNPTYEAISSTYISSIFDKFIIVKNENEKIKKTFIEMIEIPIINLTKEKEIVSNERIKRINKRAERRVMQHEFLRNIRFMFMNLSRPHISEFAIKLPKYLRGTLQDWIKENEDNYRKVMEKIAEQDEGIDEVVLHYNESLVATSSDLHLDIKGLNILGFHVTSDPVVFFPDALKRYKLYAVFFDADGKIISKCSQNINEGSGYLKFSTLEFDSKLLDNSDYSISVNLKLLPAEFDMGLFYIMDEKPQNIKDQWYINSRYKFTDEDLYQPITSYTFINMKEKTGREGEDLQQIRGFICGRIYKEEESIMLEILNLPIEGTTAIEKIILDVGEMHANKTLKAIDLSKIQSEISAQLTTSKIGGNSSKNMSKSKSNKKEDKKSKKEEKSKSKILDKSKQSQSYSKEEEKKEVKEEKFENKIKKFKDHLVGPVEIDCRTEKEEIERKFIDCINQNDIELMNECTNGFELFIHNRPIRDGEQVRKWCNKMVNIVFRPKMPQIIPDEIGQNEENQEENENRDLDNEEEEEQ